MTVPELSEKKTANTSTTLNSFLKHEGFEVVKLKQKNFDTDPKRFVIDVEINRVSALLEVDTGAGGTVIARGSLKKFRLVEHKTSIGVTAFGKKSDTDKFWSLAKLGTLAIGNCVIRGIPVGIKEIPHLDGFWGTPELHRVGAVLDCAESSLYLAGRGPSSRTRDKLAAMLQNNGSRKSPCV